MSTRAGSAAPRNAVGGFEAWDTRDLKDLHVKVLGRDLGLRGRHSLQETLRHRCDPGQACIELRVPRTAVFRGLRPGVASSAAGATLHQRAPPPATHSEPSTTRAASAANPRRRATAIATSPVPELLRLIGVNVRENESVLRRFEEFLGAPANCVRMWAESCDEMLARLNSQRYLRLLCVGFTADGKPKEARGAAYVDSDATVDGKRALWALTKRFERGPSYLTEVWKGLNRTRLSGHCDGEYFLHNAATLRVLYERNARLGVLRSRVARIRSNRQARAAVVDGDEGEEDADDTDEIFQGLPEAEEDDVPALHLHIDMGTGLLQFSFDLSPSQLAAAMNRRSNDSLTSGSRMLFRGEAGCVGVDSWLVFTDGPWKHKIIQFVRGSTAESDAADAASPRAVAPLEAKLHESRDVEAVVVDQVLFAKHKSPPCATVEDEFLCTVCGALRRSENHVYATRFGDLRRGRYPCAVCDRVTLHVSNHSAHPGSTTRQRWCPTQTVAHPPPPRLGRFAFDVYTS